MTFRRLALVVVMLLSVAAVAYAAEGDWTMTRYDEAQSGSTPQKLSPPLSLCWQYNGTKFDNNPSTPAVVGDRVYYASGDRVYALDTKSGELKWQYPSADGLKSSIKTGVTFYDGLVMFGATDGNVYALNAETGRPTWLFNTQRAVRSTPIVSNGTVYVGSDDNNVYAIDAKTGEQAWSGPFRTKDDISTPCALATGLVVFASMDSNIYGANEASGRMRWRFQLPVAAIKGGPVVSNALVFVGSGRSVCVLSTKNGLLRYKINLDSDVVAPLAMAGSDLYVICRNKKVYAYQVGVSGYKKKWENPVSVGATMTAPPTVAGDVLYIGCMRGMVCAYSTEDGKLLWRYTIAPSIVGNNNRHVSYTNIAAPVVVADGALFVVTDDGALHCFRPSAPDQTAPKIFNVKPRSATPMNGFPPLSFSAILYDESTGIDDSSIQLIIDNEKKDFTFDPSTLMVSYSLPITQPLQKMSDGRHNVTIFAKDWRGNELEYSWSILIDNSLPQRPLPKAKATADPKAKPKRPGRTTGGTEPPPIPEGPPSPDAGGPPAPPMPPMPGEPGPGGPPPGAPGAPGPY